MGVELPPAVEGLAAEVAALRDFMSSWEEVDSKGVVSESVPELVEVVLALVC